VEKENLEKQLVQLNESNMRQQTVNYSLTHKHRFFTQKAKASAARVKILQQKTDFLTETL